MVIKPAALTPLSCFRLVEILKEAGLPEGWCSVVLPARDVTEKLVCDSRTNFFSFIGYNMDPLRLESTLAKDLADAIEAEKPDILLAAPA